MRGKLFRRNSYSARMARFSNFGSVHLLIYIWRSIFSTLQITRNFLPAGMPSWTLKRSVRMFIGKLIVFWLALLIINLRLNLSIHFKLQSCNIYNLFPFFPFIRELMSHENVTFNDNGTLSTIPHHPLEWRGELSQGRSEDDILYLPNIALLVRKIWFLREQSDKDNCCRWIWLVALAGFWELPIKLQNPSNEKCCQHFRRSLSHLNGRNWFSKQLEIPELFKSPRKIRKYYSTVWQKKEETATCSFQFHSQLLACISFQQHRRSAACFFTQKFLSHDPIFLLCHSRVLCELHQSSRWTKSTRFGLRNAFSESIASQISIAKFVDGDQRRLIYSTHDNFNVVNSDADFVDAYVWADKSIRRMNKKKSNSRDSRAHF